MKRITSSVPVGGALTPQIRHKVRLESDPCEIGTQESRFFQFDLLNRAGADPVLTACGGVDFQKLIMYHSGQCWILECEAVVDGKENGT